jgi:hypothetical protein
MATPEAVLLLHNWTALSPPVRSIGNKVTRAVQEL